MSYSLHVSSQHRYGAIRFADAVDGQEMLEAGEAIVLHPEWDVGFTEVWDGTDIGGLAFSIRDLKKLVALEETYKHLVGDGPLLVITADPLRRSIVRLFTMSIRADARTTTVVATRAEAAARLGIDALYPD